MSSYEVNAWDDKIVSNFAATGFVSSHTVVGVAVSVVEVTGKKPSKQTSTHLYVYVRLFPS